MFLGVVDHFSYLMSAAAAPAGVALEKRLPRWCGLLDVDHVAWQSSGRHDMLAGWVTD